MISRRQIISRYAGPIFTIFTSNESYLVVDDRSGPLFLICQGTLPWQVLENELQYHGLAVRINSAYDACISCKKL